MNTVVLENEFIRVVVLVTYGAKIHEFTYKPSNRDFMYHHPRVECRTPVFGVNIDNWWTGGMDEAIPTGHPCSYKGEEYPFLGEVWSLPWHYEIQKHSSEEVTLYLKRPLIISPLIVERWISLVRDEKMLRFRHKITNTGNAAFEFLWGLHPAFAINPDCRINLPAGKMFVDESTPEARLGKHGRRYQWPFVTDKSGKQIDMRIIGSPTANTMDFHYATELKEGWLAITDTKYKEGVGLVFPKEIFSVAWLWLVYGGWRGIYTAAVEAWTGYPAKLSEAVEKGKYSKLEAGDFLECESKLLVHTGFSEIENISPDGKARGK
jgi:hypothetical protein